MTEHLHALADLWDDYARLLADDARTTEHHDAKVVLNAKSGTYAHNAERLREALREEEPAVAPVAFRWVRFDGTAHTLDPKEVTVVYPGGIDPTYGGPELAQPSPEPEYESYSRRDAYPPREPRVPLLCRLGWHRPDSPTSRAACTRCNAYPLAQES